MKWPWKTITLAIALAALLGGTGICLALVFNEARFLPNSAESLAPYFDTLGGRLASAVLSLVFLTGAAGLAAMLLGVEPLRSRRVVVENEAGAVGISLQAVEEFIKRKGRTVSGVRDIHVRANELNGALSLQAKLIVELQKNMPEFTQQFHHKVRHELETTLGMRNIHKVEVLIQKIYPKESSPESLLLGAPAKLLKDSDESVQESRGDNKAGGANAQADETQEENFTVIAKASASAKEPE